MREKNKYSANLNVEKEIVVELSVEQNALKAISFVLEQYGNSNHSLNVIFAEYIVDDDDQPTNVASHYEQESNTVAFAMHSPAYKSFCHALLGEKFGIMLIAAHEAKHACQAYERGYIKQGNFRQSIDDQQSYVWSDEESEAWDEALHVFKHFYPMATGGFNFCDRRFDLPEISRYGN